MSFSYQSLRPEEIRLLEVIPQSHVDEANARYDMKHVSLNDLVTLQYETISYCWGDPALSSSFTINDTIVRAPQSSIKALSQWLRVRSQSFVWIDAICINQADVEERAHQVELMGMIYSSASRNIVCLGDDTTRGRAVSTTRAISNELNDYAFAANFDGFEGYAEALLYGNTGFTEVPLQTAIDEQALLALYSCSWRAWVVQEAVLASKNTCIFGQETIDLIEIMRVAVRLSQTPAYNLSESFQTARGVANVAFMLAARLELAREGTFDFWHALLTTAQLQTTEPRDKVYSVLGLCIEGDIPKLLSVNYKKPMHQVFRDATRYVIVTKVSRAPVVDLRVWSFVLRFVCHLDQSDLYNDDYPSWVPRFDRDAHQKEEEVLNAHAPAKVCIEDDENVKEVDDAQSILLRGVEIGILQAVGPFFDREIEQQNDLLQKILSQVQELSRTHRISLEQLARILIADNTAEQNQSTAEDTVGFQNMLLHIEKKTVFPSLAELTVETEESLTSASRYWQAFLRAFRYRRYAITDQGAIVLVPRCSRSGDIVVSLYVDSGGFPYILRSESTYFRMVGACYVDGSMPWQETGNGLSTSKSEWFEIH